MQEPKMKPGHSAAGKTDVGRERDHNEDHLLVHRGLGLFVVADGMGGNNAGEVASALATTSMKNFFEATADAAGAPRPTGDPAELAPDAQRLAASIKKANGDIFEISSTMSQHRGMGSTIVAAYLPPQSTEIYIANVGDSRCYRIRDGTIKQLTRDHSLVGDALAWNPNLTERELALLPKNIISRALGLKDSVDVDIRAEEIRVGDVYLLCSDGLSGMVTDATMLETVTRLARLEDTCKSLVAQANEAGGTDNITVLLVRIEQQEARTDAAAPAADAAAPAADAAALAADATAPAADAAAPAADAAAPAIFVSEMDEEEAMALFDLGDEQPANGADPSPQAGQSPHKTCGACHHPVGEGEVFCGHCGAPLG
jgi:PPM family protein phosphatase